MTENEAEIRRAVSMVQSAFPSGGGDWAKKRFETWVAAVADLDASAVSEAAAKLVRDWSESFGRSPYPGHLREATVSIMRIRDGIQPTGVPHPTTYEPTPAWFARLVVAGVCIRLKAPVSKASAPYAALLRDFGIDREPAWSATDAQSLAVFEAARAIAARHGDEGEADGRILRELPL